MGTHAWRTARFPALGMKAGVQHKPYWFYPQFRHSDPLLAVNCGILLKSRFQMSSRCHPRANFTSRAKIAVRPAVSTPFCKEALGFNFLRFYSSR